ncbi:GNAT family N-acetyltransferase [Actinoplanes xinjiangensis]|uniref:GNAT family N-acetyltransferase n=1 Tax=Actinoplanes xinjiangensis TaxID=512350 RepID=UPI0034447AC4
MTFATARTARPDLDDGVVRLRRWALDDLACVRAASREGIIPEGTTVPAAYTDEAGRQFIERQWHRTTDGQGWSSAIASVETGEALGCAVLLLRPQDGVAGIGYWLVPAARGLGYASRAVALLTGWALAGDGAALTRVEAWVEPGNVASSRVLESCGYHLEGRLRSFLALPSRRADVLVYSRIHSDPPVRGR